MIFAPVPGFKPVAAMTAVCGMAFGRESGFLCGSLSAFISNFFFGQGPWTPFQMIAWGSIGWFAGVLNKDGRMEKHKISAVVFGIAAGIWFSLVMNLWVDDRSRGRDSVDPVWNHMGDISSSHDRILCIQCTVSVDFDSGFHETAESGKI